VACLTWGYLSQAVILVSAVHVLVERLLHSSVFLALTGTSVLRKKPRVRLDSVFEKLAFKKMKRRVLESCFRIYASTA